MRTIGLLGGMSWESSIEYERLINEEVRRRLGGVHSADLVIRSYDFSTIETLQVSEDWEGAGELLATDAKALETAGAELIVLCTNTMHCVADAIEAAIDVPFLHLADATARAVRAAEIETVALLGTRYTMEMPFYRERLEASGLTVLIPEAAGREAVHEIIFGELVRGKIRPESKAVCAEIIDDLIGSGAEGVIAGCTEIELLVRPEDVNCPYFPTTRLHAMAAAEASLEP